MRMFLPIPGLIARSVLVRYAFDGLYAAGAALNTFAQAVYNSSIDGWVIGNLSLERLKNTPQLSRKAFNMGNLIIFVFPGLTVLVETITDSNTE